MIDDVLQKCQSTGLFLQERPLGVNDTNIFGDTPLHLVSHWGSAKAVAALLSAGAEVNAKGERGQTPLFFAVSTEVADLLLAAGADPGVIDEFNHSAETFLRSVGLTKVADYIAQTRRS